MWFHVDAAYGGFFQLTERGRAAFRGSERADSITLDPHKGLFLPYGTGGLIVRDREAMRDAHFEGAAYLQDLPPSGELPNYNELTPELSRDVRGLRVWFPLVLHGVAAFRDALDEKLDLTAADHGLAARRSEPGGRLGSAAHRRRVPHARRRRGALAAVAGADQRDEARVPVLDADPGGVLVAGLHRVAPDARRPDRRVRDDRARRPPPRWPERCPSFPRSARSPSGSTRSRRAACFAAADVLSFSSLKTVTPRPVELAGATVAIRAEPRQVRRDRLRRRAPAAVPSVARRSRRRGGAAQDHEAPGGGRPVPTRRSGPRSW